MVFEQLKPLTFLLFLYARLWFEALKVGITGITWNYKSLDSTRSNLKKYSSHLSKNLKGEQLTFFIFVLNRRLARSFVLHFFLLLILSDRTCLKIDPILENPLGAKKNSKICREMLLDGFHTFWMSDFPFQQDIRIGYDLRSNRIDQI